MDLDHDCSHHHHPVSPDKAVVVNQALTFYEQNLGRLPTDTRRPRSSLPLVYPRTFAVLTFILSGASFAASYIFIANATSLDCDEIFRQWESASHQLNILASLDFRACRYRSLLWSGKPSLHFAPINRCLQSCRSICFCMMTLFSLAWIHQGTTTPGPTPATSKIDLTFGHTFTAFKILCLAFQFYRVRQFLPDK